MYVNQTVQDLTGNLSIIYSSESMHPSPELAERPENDKFMKYNDQKFHGVLNYEFILIFNFKKNVHLKQ